MKTGQHTGFSFRTGIAFLLLAAFLYNVFGYFVVFRVNRSVVRAGMRKELALSRQKVVVIRLFDAEKDPTFRRVDKNEFELKGQLYDVLFESTRDRTTIFYCIRDTREEMLMDGMRKASRAKNSQNFVHNLITLAMPVGTKPEPLQYSCDISFPFTHYKLLHRPADPLSPPPKTC